MWKGLACIRWIFLNSNSLNSLSISSLPLYSYLFLCSWRSSCPRIQLLNTFVPNCLWPALHQCFLFGSSILFFRYTYWHVHGRSTHWRFLCIISWRRLWGWVISHITISKTNSYMMLTRSMATTNQETKNPPSTLERQVQTLVVVVERLTQRNYKLEWQLEQWND